MESHYPKKYWWIVLIVVPIVAAMIGIIPGLIGQRKVSPLSSQVWDLKGRVISKNTEQPIQGAKVSLESQGNTHVIDTDSEGVYQFTVQASTEKLTGRIMVDAEGYISYNKLVEIFSEQPAVDTIWLTPQEKPVSRIPTPAPAIHVVQIFVTPTPVPPLIHTATPKPEPMATPIPNPTATPKLKPTAPPPPPTHDIVICIVDAQNTFHTNFSQGIMEFFQTHGIKTTTTSINTIGPVSSFDNIIAGNTAEVSQSKLSRYGKFAILGKAAVSFFQNPDLENVITANVSLTCYFLSSYTGNIQQSFTISQKGPGFSRTDAANKAEERILQELGSHLRSIIDHL